MANATSPVLKTGKPADDCLRQHFFVQAEISHQMFSIGGSSSAFQTRCAFRSLRVRRTFQVYQASVIDVCFSVRDPRLCGPACQFQNADDLIFAESALLHLLNPPSSSIAEAEIPQFYAG